MSQQSVWAIVLAHAILFLCECQSHAGESILLPDRLLVATRLPPVRVQPILVTRLPPIRDQPILAHSVPAASTSFPDLPRLPVGSCPLTLYDAFNLSLRNSDVVRTLDEGSIGVQPGTFYDPIIAEQARTAAIAAFDINYGANFFWNRFDGPPNSFFGPGIPRSERRDEGTYTTGFWKRWSPGTETRVFYNPYPGYLYYPNGNSGGFNPNHVSALELSVRQPILRNAGSETNLAPIKIAQLRTDQSSVEFKQSMLQFIRSVEEAYWNLQAARVAEHALEEQVPLINEVVRIAEANMAAERAVLSDVAKARTQQYALRQRLAEATTNVQARELQLRTLIGIDYDNCALIPTTEPIRAPIVIDPESTFFTALDRQPNLIRQRIELHIREVQLSVARNQFHPQFDVQALYRMNGLDERLDSSLGMMAGQDFVDWEFGAIFSMPLGRNADRAKIRAAELQLQRDRAWLRENTRLLIYELRDTLRRIGTLYEQYQAADARLQAAHVWQRGARIRYENPPPIGADQNWMLIALDDYLLAMRSTADAATETSFLLANYNTELARLKELEGTLLSSNNILLLNDVTNSAVIQHLPRIVY